MKNVFKKQDNEDRRASGTSLEQEEINDAMHDIIEQFEDAAKMHDETTGEKKEKKRGRSPSGRGDELSLLGNLRRNPSKNKKQGSKVQ